MGVGLVTLGENDGRSGVGNVEGFEVSGEFDGASVGEIEEILGPWLGLLILGCRDGLVMLGENDGRLKVGCFEGFVVSSEFDGAWVGEEIGELLGS